MRPYVAPDDAVWDHTQQEDLEYLLLALEFYPQLLLDSPSLQARLQELVVRQTSLLLPPLRTGDAGSFNLQLWDDSAAIQEFRMERALHVALAASLFPTGRFVTPAGDNLPGLEVLAIVLWRLSHTGTLRDMEHVFHRQPPNLSRIFNAGLRWIHECAWPLVHPLDANDYIASCRSAFTDAVSDKLGFDIGVYGFGDPKLCKVMREVCLYCFSNC